MEQPKKLLPTQAQSILPCEEEEEVIKSDSESDSEEETEEIASSPASPASPEIEIAVDLNLKPIVTTDEYIQNWETKLETLDEQGDAKVFTFYSHGRSNLQTRQLDSRLIDSKLISGSKRGLPDTWDKTHKPKIAKLEEQLRLEEKLTCFLGKAHFFADFDDDMETWLEKFGKDTLILKVEFTVANKEKIVYPFEK